jgi:ParB-like chromosome segregation protein Spo0J
LYIKKLNKGDVMATKKTAESPEFLYLPMGSIIVEEQIRSKIDAAGESFKALMESIKDKGILEPVLITPKDDKYLLLCGERRFLAAQKLGHESIPARVVNAVTQRDEILAIQLTENLQREDLNPIDQANGIRAFFQAKHPDNVYNLDGVMSTLVSYSRRPEDLPEEIALTVRAIIEISAKSIQTVHRTISLLKLVPKIQEAIVDGKLPVSQGYLFAANLGSPDFFTIFDEIMEKPVTNAKLEKILTAYKKAKNLPSGAVAGGLPSSVLVGGKSTSKPMPIKKKVAVLQNAKSYFEKKTGMYARSDIQTFLDELRVLVSFMEEQVQKAPEKVNVKKPDNKPRPQV